MSVIVAGILGVLKTTLYKDLVKDKAFGIVGCSFTMSVDDSTKPKDRK